MAYSRGQHEYHIIVGCHVLARVDRKQMLAGASSHTLLSPKAFQFRRVEKKIIQCRCFKIPAFVFSDQLAKSLEPVIEKSVRSREMDSDTSPGPSQVSPRACPVDLDQSGGSVNLRRLHYWKVELLKIWRNGRTMGSA